MDFMDDLPEVDPLIAEEIRKILEGRQSMHSADLIIPIGNAGLGRTCYTNDAGTVFMFDPSSIEQSPINPFEIYYLDEYKIPKVSYTLTDPDDGLSEWQKRRNQSARAKADLIAKMRKNKS